jgi:general secretion pathway protein G
MKRCQRAGFTLIEILLALAIVSTLAAIAIPAYSLALDASRVSRTIADVRAIGLSIKMDEVLRGQLPNSLEQAGLAHFRDPWGQPYFYLRIAGGGTGMGELRKDHKLNPINSDFDLYSMGKDRQTKTQLTNKDSLDDIVRATDGAFVGLAADF